MSAHITVLGSFVAGLTVRLPRMPIPGESLRAEAFDLGPGGKGTNLAVAATRLGAKVSLIVKVGEDDFGRLAERVLETEGIYDPHLFRSADDATGVGLVYLDSSGENMIGFYPGANMAMGPDEVDTALDSIPSTSILTAQLEVPTATVEHAFSWARERGVRTLLNPAPAREVPRTLFELIDVLTPNFNEAFAILGEPVPSTASPDTVEVVGRRLQAMGPPIVVVTLGKHGAMFFEGDEPAITVPPIEVKPVDTVGAGDAFNAGLAVALVEGASVHEAARFAAVGGGLATRRLGVIEALPFRRDVDGYLSGAS